MSKYIERPQAVKGPVEAWQIDSDEAKPDWVPDWWIQSHRIEGRYIDSEGAGRWLVKFGDDFMTYTDDDFKRQYHDA